MAAELLPADSLEPGDTLYLPSGAERRVDHVAGPYEDGTVVVVYSTGRSSRSRFGEEYFHTPDVLQSIAPVMPDELVRARRRHG
jgi:hypothetical protein